MGAWAAGNVVHAPLSHIGGVFSYEVNLLKPDAANEEIPVISKCKICAGNVS